jgi:hypothetical protein
MLANVSRMICVPLEAFILELNGKLLSSRNMTWVMVVVVPRLVAGLMWPVSCPFVACVLVYVRK